MRVVIGDGPVQEVLRYDRGKGATKKVKTKLIQCTECQDVTTVIYKPSLIDKVLASDCRNCQRVSRDKRIEEKNKEKRRLQEERRQVNIQRKKQKALDNLCVDCGKEKPIVNGRGRRSKRCDECSHYQKKIHNRSHRYGISRDQLESLIHESGMRCQNPGCNADVTISKRGEGKQWNNMNIDHCHDTNKVRGVLCHSCNFALGHLSDSLDKIIGLGVYLQESRS